MRRCGEDGAGSSGGRGTAYASESARSLPKLEMRLAELACVPLYSTAYIDENNGDPDEMLKAHGNNLWYLSDEVVMSYGQKPGCFSNFGL